MGRPAAAKRGRRRVSGETPWCIQKTPWNGEKTSWTFGAKRYIPLSKGGIPLCGKDIYPLQAKVYTSFIQRYIPPSCRGVHLPDEKVYTLSPRKSAMFLRLPREFSGLSGEFLKFALPTRHKRFARTTPPAPYIFAAGLK